MLRTFWRLIHLHDIEFIVSIFSTLVGTDTAIHIWESSTIHNHVNAIMAINILVLTFLSVTFIESIGTV